MPSLIRCWYLALQVLQRARERRLRRSSTGAAAVSAAPQGISRSSMQVAAAAGPEQGFAEAAEAKGTEAGDAALGRQQQGTPIAVC